jgi:hypothetical protein
MRRHAKVPFAVAVTGAEAGSDAEQPRGMRRLTVTVTNATVHQLEMNQTELL